MSSGSLTDAEGGVRAYLHTARLRKVAGKLEGKDAELLLAAADAMALLAKRNQMLGRRVGARMSRSRLAERGLSVTKAEAAERICELAADGPVTAYTLGRDPKRVRITSSDRLPRGGKRIGRFDITADYRDVQRKVSGVLDGR